MKFLLLLTFPLLFVACSNGSKIHVTQTDEGFLFTENGANVMFYQQAPKSFDGAYTRNNYVHPLWSLDGDTLTEDYPPDHAHHRGIFWTWHRVYVGDTRLGDAWECRDFVWDVIDANIEEENGGTTLAVTVLWKSPDFVDEAGEMIPAVQENTRITVHPRTKSYRALDFDIRLLALQDSVKIGGSDDVKGYGGFSPRVKLPDDLIFLSSTGPVEPQNEAIVAGPWMNLLGSFNGESVSGFAILNHPKNPPPINDWILRSARSMQNPVYPGRALVAVSQKQPTVLRYRVLVHDGSVDVEKMYEAFEGI